MGKGEGCLKCCAACGLTVLLIIGGSLLGTGSLLVRVSDDIKADASLSSEKSTYNYRVDNWKTSSQYAFPSNARTFARRTCSISISPAKDTLAGVAVTNSPFAVETTADPTPSGTGLHTYNIFARFVYDPTPFSYVLPLDSTLTADEQAALEAANYNTSLSVRLGFSNAYFDEVFTQPLWWTTTYPRACNIATGVCACAFNGTSVPSRPGYCQLWFRLKSVCNTIDSYDEFSDGTGCQPLGDAIRAMPGSSSLTGQKLGKTFGRADYEPYSAPPNSLNNPTARANRLGNSTVWVFEVPFTIKHERDPWYAALDLTDGSFFFPEGGDNEVQSVGNQVQSTGAGFIVGGLFLLIIPILLCMKLFNCCPVWMDPCAKKKYTPPITSASPTPAGQAGTGATTTNPLSHGPPGGVPVAVAVPMQPAYAYATSGAPMPPPPGGAGGGAPGSYAMGPPPPSYPPPKTV